MEPVTAPLTVSSHPSTEQQKTPSFAAKKIADLFIAALSKENHSRTATPHEFLTQEEHRALTSLCTPETIRILYEKGEGTEFRVLARGKHNTVWVHPQHPKVVLKVMKKELAKKQESIAHKAFAAAQQIERSWVKIPRATTIDCDAISVYVEERLPLELDMDQHQEVWAHVLRHYKSEQVTETFKKNLKTVIDQIQALIEQVGFWDVGYHNLPEVCSDGSGVCGTDFENVESDLSNKHDGLENLAKLVPYPSLCKNVLAALDKEFPHTAERRKKKIKEMYAAFPQFAPPVPDEQQLRHTFRCSLDQALDVVESYTTALEAYERRGYVSGDEAIAVLKISEWSQEEKTLAEELMASIKKRQEETNGIKLSLCRKRSISFQPGAGIPPFSSKICQAAYTHERFAAVLRRLEKQEVVLGWSSDVAHRSPNDPLVSYTILF